MPYGHALHFEESGDGLGERSLYQYSSNSRSCLMIGFGLNRLSKVLLSEHVIHLVLLSLLHFRALS